MSEGEIPTLEYDSPYPECRVTATADPVGMVRLDVSRERAALITQQVRDTIRDHSVEGLLALSFVMGRRPYTHLAENIHRIKGDGDADVVQVVLGEDPSISIGVLLNAKQVDGLAENLPRNLDRTPDAGTCVWQVSVSRNGAVMLVEQLVAAIQGHQNPIETVDIPDGGGGE